MHHGNEYTETRIMIVRQIFFACLVALARFSFAAGPPVSLTVGGQITFPSNSTPLVNSAVRIYPVSDPSRSTIAAAVPTEDGWWHSDAGSEFGSTLAGSEIMAVASLNVEEGARTGYYAVASQILKGDDPAEFPPVTLRPIPVPAVTSAALAYLVWDAAIEDESAGGETNIIGYAVLRSPDGTNYVVVSTSLVSGTSCEDVIPDDGEYYYSLGLIYRGSPPVTSSVFSAKSNRVFKDTDADGLPDYYESANGLDIASGSDTNGPSGDADGDSMSNFEEWIAGTAANNPSSYFFAKYVMPPGSNIVVQWNGYAGRSYVLERIGELASTNWISVYGPAPCDADQGMSFEDSNASATNFYRIRVIRD